MSDENINICINVVTKKSISEAGNKLDELGKKGASAGKKIDKATANTKSRLDQIKNAAGFATAGLAALTAVAVKSLRAFKSFENGLINVEKVTNISGKNLASFGKEIDRLANRIPVGTSELLNISQTAGQLGIEGTKNILAFTEAVALLTRTTDLTIDSAQSLAQLIEVSGTAPEDVGRLAAVVVELGNNFSATESQILDVSTRIAQSTTQFNLLAEDAVKLGAVIAGVGEKAEASGTAIGKTFRSLETAIVAGGPPLEKLTELTGLQRDELSRLFENNPTELLRKFTQGLGEAKKAGELVPVILSDFGLKTDRVNRVLGPLIKNTDKVNEAFKRTSDQIENQNAAVEEANKQFRSLESAEILTNNATTQLAKTIGTTLAPAYRSILETTRTISISLTRFVEDNSSALKIVAGAVIGLGVAFASIAVPAGIAFLGITTAITIMIAKITLLGATIAGIVVYWDDITLVAKKFAADMIFILGDIIDGFSKFAKAIGISTEAMEEGSKSLLEYSKQLQNEIKQQEESNKKKEEAARLEKDKIVRIRELEDKQESLRKTILLGDKESSISAQKEIKAIDLQIQSLNNLDTKSKEVALTRSQQLKELTTLRQQLTNSIDNASGGNQLNIAKEINLIDQKIQKIRELNVAEENDKKVAEAQKRADKIAQVEIDLQSKIELVNRVANDKTTDGIKQALKKQSEAKLKQYRDDAIALGDFNAARRAERQLDALETEAQNEATRQKELDKAVEAERAKQESVREIKKEFEDLEAEEAQLKILLEVEEDERQLENINLRLENIRILKLENQKRELEEEGAHLAALEKQRQIDGAKEKKSLKVRSDSEIRQARATAQLKRIIAQTTGEQLIGIGDNLMKAGIIQGKTAGNALKGLKTGEAIINTYAGANRALSSLPFPANALAAASVIASGLANVVQIQQQKFATGGIVQPAGTASRGIDNVPALLSVGEEVLTKNNPRHRDNISRDQDRALLEAINGLRGDIQGMQTIVNIDGKEVADVIQEQRFRGVR